MPNGMLALFISIRRHTSSATKPGLGDECCMLLRCGDRLCRHHSLAAEIYPGKSRSGDRRSPRRLTIPERHSSKARYLLQNVGSIAVETHNIVRQLSAMPCRGCRTFKSDDIDHMPFHNGPILATVFRAHSIRTTWSYSNNSCSIDSMLASSIVTNAFGAVLTYTLPVYSYG